MSKENGFVPIRRGLWEHLRDGRMSPFESLAFIYICSQADTRTGVWKGSAGALVTELGFNARTSRDVLERMEGGDYIRRFAISGVRHCYPILVHKFPITQGEHNGELLDALSSTKQDGLLELRFISCEVHGEVHGEVHASQRRSKNEEVRRKPDQKPAQTPRGSNPPFKSEQEQRQIVQARDTRIEKEGEARKKAQAGRNWISDQLEAARQASAPVELPSEIRQLARAKSLPVQMSAKQLDERRRFLLRQAEELKAKYGQARA